jgi:5-methylcytosine-specific restriction endonuclease McrA
VVGPPGDRYEREADRIARAVAHGAAGPATGVQAFAASGAAQPGSTLQTRIRAATAGGGGQRIPGQVRAPLEHALGADLSGVRVHDDAGADRLSRSLHASALTTGQDIFFRRGTYAPGSHAGNALLTHEVVHVLQQRGGPAGAAGAVQLFRPENFKTLDEAKDRTTQYSKALLHEQLHDKLGQHIGKEFTAAEREKIYRVNKGRTKDIRSDVDKKILHRQDLDKTPHVDHRYPKSLGGSNSYKNAAVLPARVNLAKSAKVRLKRPPTQPLAPYRDLVDPDVVETHREFSAEQRRAIYQANKDYYGVGQLVSDHDKKTRLEPYDSEQVPHIDHITPRSSGGSSYYFNARVVSAATNLDKGGQRGGSQGENKYGYDERRMTLGEFIDYTQNGTIPSHFMESSESSDSMEEEPARHKRPRSGSDPTRKVQRTSAGRAPVSGDAGTGSTATKTTKKKPRKTKRRSK